MVIISNFALSANKCLFFNEDLEVSKVAANEKGLAFVGELEFRQPITEAQ